MEPDLATLLATKPELTPPPRSRGGRIAIGLGASLLVWFVVDELMAVVSPWVIGAVVVVGIGLLLRFKASRASQQFQIILLMLAGVIGSILLIAFFSLFNIWIFMLMTVGLAAVVLYKSRQQNQRQAWLDSGCCGACGYDLRGTPDRCPECGRDTLLDEPTWRKLRREWKPKKPDAQLPIPVIAIDAPPQLPAVKGKPTVLKTPDFHEGPIPLE